MKKYAIAVLIMVLMVSVSFGDYDANDTVNELLGAGEMFDMSYRRTSRALDDAVHERYLERDWDGLVALYGRMVTDFNEVGDNHRIYWRAVIRAAQVATNTFKELDTAGEWLDYYFENVPNEYKEARTVARAYEIRGNIASLSGKAEEASDHYITAANELEQMIGDEAKLFKDDMTFKMVVKDTEIGDTDKVIDHNLADWMNIIHAYNPTDSNSYGKWKIMLGSKYFNRGWKFKNSNDDANAVEAFEMSQDIFAEVSESDSPRYYAYAQDFIADAHTVLGNDAQAEVIYQDLVDNHEYGRKWEAMYSLAKLQEKRGALSDAKATFGRLATDYPENRISTYAAQREALIKTDETME